MTPDEYKATREKLGLTQAGLAARLGVTRGTINRRENGDPKAPITEEAALAIRALKPRRASPSNIAISHAENGEPKR